MGANVTNHELAEELEAQLTALLTATKASRVTLRLDLPKYAFHVDDVAAEARKPGVASLKGQTSIDQRRAPTVIWLDRERRLLGAARPPAGRSRSATRPYPGVRYDSADACSARDRQRTRWMDLGSPQWWDA